MPKLCPSVREGALTNSPITSRNAQLTTLSRTSRVNLATSAEFLGQVIETRVLIHLNIITASFKESLSLTGSQFKDLIPSEL